jgi:hypothetical protein
VKINLLFIEKMIIFINGNRYSREENCLL